MVSFYLKVKSVLSVHFSYKAYLLVAPGATLVNGLTSFTILGALASGGRIFLTFGSSPGRAGSTLIRKSDLQTPVLFFASMAYSPAKELSESLQWSQLTVYLFRFILASNQVCTAVSSSVSLSVCPIVCLSITQGVTLVKNRRNQCFPKNETQGWSQKGQSISLDASSHLYEGLSISQFFHPSQLPCNSGKIDVFQ